MVMTTEGGEGKGVGKGVVVVGALTVVVVVVGVVGGANVLLTHARPLHVRPASHVLSSRHGQLILEPHTDIGHVCTGVGADGAAGCGANGRGGPGGN